MFKGKREGRSSKVVGKTKEVTGLKTSTRNRPLESLVSLPA